MPAKACLVAIIVVPLVTDTGICVPVSVFTMIGNSPLNGILSELLTVPMKVLFV